MRQRVLGISLILGAGLLAAGAQAAAAFNAANPPPIAPLSGMILYSDAKLGFAIAYPPYWTVNSAYKYEALGAGKAIPGISFTISAQRIAGTNLAGDTRLSVERLAGPGACQAGRFVDSAQNQHTQTSGDRTYSVATSSEGAAGNLYEETVYALPGTSPCIAIRYFIHSTNIGNYDPGMVKEFDRDALMKTFGRMRRSLALTK
jgi:hypothetical protein